MPKPLINHTRKGKTTTPNQLKEVLSSMACSIGHLIKVGKLEMQRFIDVRFRANTFIMDSKLLPLFNNSIPECIIKFQSPRTVQDGMFVNYPNSQIRNKYHRCHAVIWCFWIRFWSKKWTSKLSKVSLVSFFKIFE